MGSGGMIVMDDTACMVDVARYFMDFCRDESCGKCVPCRVGTTQMHTPAHRDLRRATPPWPTWTSWSDCRDMVKHTSLCGLGQTRPQPGVLRRCATSATSTSPTSRTATCPAGVVPARRRGRSVHMSVVHPDDRRHARRRRRRPDASWRSPPRTASTSRRCATSTASPTSAPAGCAWSRWPARRKLLPACVTAVAEGMEVRPPRRGLAEYRRTILEMLFVGAQPRLLGVRGQRPLRAAGPGREPGRRPRSAAGYQPAASASTPATRCSASTTTAASCAPAACGSATRSRAPTPGT